MGDNILGQLVANEISNAATLDGVNRNNFDGVRLLGAVFVLVAISSRFPGAQNPVVHNAGDYGDLSYGIYLYAWPVQQVVVLALGKTAPYWLLAICSLAVATALAYASWHLVEKLALRLKPRNRRGQKQGSFPEIGTQTGDRYKATGP